MSHFYDLALALDVLVGPIPCCDRCHKREVRLVPETTSMEIISKPRPRKTGRAAGEKLTDEVPTATLGVHAEGSRSIHSETA